MNPVSFTEQFAGEIKFALGILVLCAAALVYYGIVGSLRTCAEPDRVAQLLDLSGKAYVRSSLHTDDERVFKRGSLHIGEVIRTTAGSAVELRLSAGEELSLNGATELEVPAGPNCSVANRIVLHGGSLRLKGRTERVLWIESGKKKIEFINGDAVLARQQDETTTRVYRGDLVIHESGERRVVSAHQKASFNGTTSVDNLKLQPAYPEHRQRILTAVKQKNVLFQWKFAGEGVVHMDLGREPDFVRPLFAEEVDGTSQELELNTGTYYWRLRASDPTGRSVETSETRSITILPAEPARLVGPLAGRKFELTGATRSVDFHWRFPEPGARFRVEVAQDRHFKNIIKTRESRETTARLKLPAGSFWWRVITGWPGQRDGVASNAARLNVGSKKELAALGVRAVSPRGGRRLNPFYRNGISFYWRGSRAFDRFKIEMYHFKNGRKGRRVFQANTKRRDYRFTSIARLRAGSYRWVITGYQENGLTAHDHGDFQVLRPPPPAPVRTGPADGWNTFTPIPGSPGVRPTPNGRPGPGRSGGLAPPGNSEVEIIRPLQGGTR